MRGEKKLQRPLTAHERKKLQFLDSVSHERMVPMKGVIPQQKTAPSIKSNFYINPSDMMINAQEVDLKDRKTDQTYVTTMRRNTPIVSYDPRPPISYIHNLKTNFSKTQILYEQGIGIGTPQNRDTDVTNRITMGSEQESRRRLLVTVDLQNPRSEVVLMEDPISSQGSPSPQNNNFKKMASYKSIQFMQQQHQQLQQSLRIHSTHNSLAGSQSQQVLPKVNTNLDLNKRQSQGIFLGNKSDIPFQQFVIKEILNSHEAIDREEQEKLKKLKAQSQSLTQLVSTKHYVQQNENPDIVKELQKTADEVQIQEETEYIMNNQIDINKLTPRSKLNELVNQNRQPQTKKQRIFLKRQIEECKRLIRPISAKNVMNYETRLSQRNSIVGFGSSKIKNFTQAQLKAFIEEIENNALWFSEDKYQTLVISKIDALLQRSKQSQLQKHLDRHKEYYKKFKIASLDEIRNHWQKLVGRGRHMESDEVLTLADTLIKLKQFTQDGDHKDDFKLRIQNFIQNDQ